ncbi:hypothetical protein F4819DRAFT_315932 [Hypoxylon fuscum]|nr:hypothetical protein F4819DRAFT_315932 [Hypoxylon fuscum]
MISDSEEDKYEGGKPPCKVHSKTIVEEAPSHDDDTPCFTAWTLWRKFHKSLKNHPNLASKRPKWSIQVYDTTPGPRNTDHLRSLAKMLHETTWEARSVMGRDSPDRIDIYGLALPAEMPEIPRVERCVEHQKAEIAARNRTGKSDFYIPPSFDNSGLDCYNRHILIIDKKEDSWNKEPGGFIRVSFDRRLDRKAKSSQQSTKKKEEETEEYQYPDIHSSRLTYTKLQDYGLWAFRESIEWFYNCYVMDGMLETELNEYKQ